MTVPQAITPEQRLLELRNAIRLCRHPAGTPGREEAKVMVGEFVTTSIVKVSAKEQAQVTIDQAFANALVRTKAGSYEAITDLNKLVSPLIASYSDGHQAETFFYLVTDAAVNDIAEERLNRGDWEILRREGQEAQSIAISAQRRLVKTLKTMLSGQLHGKPEDIYVAVLSLRVRNVMTDRANRLRLRGIHIQLPDFQEDDHLMRALAELEVDDQPDVSDVAAEQEIMHKAEQQISPIHERMAHRLHHYEGMPVPVLAKLMDMTPAETEAILKNVRTQVNIQHRKLRG